MAAPPTIFVSIASYRDPDCQYTVRDLFEKAAHPERVRIGICWQFVPGEDDDCFVIQTRPEQVRTVEVHAGDARGACWARHRAQQLWRGEDYYLQIDSHMRFAPAWDDKFIAMLDRCDAAKPVLSSYPLEFTPPDRLAKDAVVTIHPKGFDEHGILAQRSTFSPLDRAPPTPAASAFVGAGLLFARAGVVAEVPYDPHLYFSGEEISLAARLWTSGWDIFSPNDAIAYHDYGNRPDRPRHWQDQVDWIELGRRSWRRVRHLLDMEQSDDAAALQDIGQYGLGHARSLAEYEKFSEVDFKGRLYRGQPLPLPRLAADQPTQIKARQSVFAYIWRENFWKSAETRSGHGSTLAATRDLRARLPELWRFLGVRILADAGCGDLNWMRELLPELRFYFGYDIVPDLIETLRARHADLPHCFFTAADIVTATLPECDAVLCRDCLTHLPPDAALMALARFRQSGARFLLATTHASGRNTWVDSGGWQAMDLTAAPFGLPPPRLQIAEGGTKSLGIWAADDLPS